MNSFDRTTTVAQIVAQHSECARVFQARRIDFCCRGDVTVAQACEGRELDPEEIFAELEAAVSERAGTAPREDLRHLTVPTLIARIIDRHHAYLLRALPFLEPLVAKVAAVHGEHNPKLVRLKGAFLELKGMLLPHLEQEETVLFPSLMARIVDHRLIREELARMHQDHLAVGDVLRTIRGHADDFTAPEWACNSYRALMSELESLECDILNHVHLENHVLMPRFDVAKPQVC